MTISPQGVSRSGLSILSDADAGAVSEMVERLSGVADWPTGQPGAGDGVAVVAASAMLTPEKVRRFVEAAAGRPLALLCEYADEVDRILGLELGADDVLAATMSWREVRARVAALMRRSRQYAHAALEPAWSFDTGRLTLTAPSGRTYRLTENEVRIIRTLDEAAGAPVPPSAIQEASGARDWSAPSAISRLRRKLGEGRALIGTAYGGGYYLSAPIHRSETSWTTERAA